MTPGGETDRDPPGLDGLPAQLVTAPFTPDRAEELVRTWRAAFERAVGIRDPHPLEDQLAYLDREVLPRHEVLLVLDGARGPLVAFLAFSKDEIGHLYVHVDHQRKGIGSALLDHAKQCSDGRLRLFTFQSNLAARRFYERHGFRVIARGFEPQWQLPDLQYEWVRAP